jgi:hypothetical protein
MLAFLYSIGWLSALWRLGVYLKQDTFDFGLKERLFCWLVFCIPMGKLLYFHFSGLIGLKITFVVWTLIGGFACFWSLCLKRIKLSALLLFCALLFFPVLSLGFLADPWSLIAYTADGQTDSLLARLISLSALVLFMLYVWHFCSTFGVQPLLKAFMDGMIVASIIGVFIFVLVYSGQVGVDELLAISADTHIVSLVYRFNPGANVNEFGILAAYALLLVRFSYPGISGKKLSCIYFLLTFALFFSLTRAAWLAYLFALLLGALIGGKGRFYILLGLTLAPLFVWLVYLINDDFAQLVSSRIALDGGASGDERIEKVMTAFFSGDLSVWNYVFGNGWATNLYMHSVPLQLLYEVGVVGFLFLSMLMFWMLLRLLMRAIVWKDAAVTATFSCVSAFAFFSAFHHTVYHMQTWFILGLGLFFAYSKRGQFESSFLSEKQHFSNIGLSK